MIGWQAQITGKKKWRLQSPLRDEQLLDFPDKAFIDAKTKFDHSKNSDISHTKKTLIYDFEMNPGDILVWNVQVSTL